MTEFSILGKNKLRKEQIVPLARATLTVDLRQPVTHSKKCSSEFLQPPITEERLAVSGDHRVGGA